MSERIDDRYLYAYGRHTVEAALTLRPDVVKALYLRDDVRDLFPEALRAKVPMVTTFSGKKLPVPVEGDVVHQGVFAKIDKEAFLADYDTFMKTLAPTNDTCVIVLGEIHDPHNVGAVIRSAAAFGVSAIMVPKHRQAGITPAVLKVSVGTAFSVPIIEIGNVNRAIEDLKQTGFFVYGLAGEGSAPLSKESFTKPTAFVLGNEAEGLREKTREHCDVLLTIPMHQRAESLNASVSAAVALYAWSAQHPGALGH